MLACFDNNAAAAETLINPFTAIPITSGAINHILTKKAAELLDCLLRAKWWAYFTHCIEHGSHALFVCNRQRKTVTCTARWVNERAVDVAPVIGPLANTRVNAGLNAFACDEALDVGAKLRTIFGLGPNRVFFVFLIDNCLLQSQLYLPR